MNIDGIKTAHTPHQFRVSSFKPDGHNHNIRTQIEQDIKNFKGKIEVIAQGVTREFMTHRELVDKYAVERKTMKALCLR